MTREEFPESVVEIVERSARLHPNEISQALACAKRDILALKKGEAYQKLMDQLFTMAIQDLIYDVRHRDNVKLRHGNGEFFPVPKVEPGLGESVRKVADQVYNYFIAGQTLGEVLGEDLMDIADSEEQRAHGHLFNVRLCRALRSLVSNGKKVREAVPATKLKKLFKKLQGGQGEAPAA